MSKLPGTLLVLALLQIASLPLPAEDAPAKVAEQPAIPDREKLEKDLTAKLTGAVFSGFFSTSGDKSDKPPQMEKYTISKAVKLKGDFWQFQSRMQYGNIDVTVPFVLEIKWAGDTPVITLTDLTIPPLGTFTSRVLIYGDQYAGTWQHGAAGGHLWGRIEKAPAAK